MKGYVTVAILLQIANNYNQLIASSKHRAVGMTMVIASVLSKDQVIYLNLVRLLITELTDVFLL